MFRVAAWALVQLLVLVSIEYALARAEWRINNRTDLTPPATAVRTEKDLGPIFRCSGAGAEVLVFLGQDSSTLTWTCLKVES